jgi:glycosyltransferase involved in cell wall biosynthesis
LPLLQDRQRWVPLPPFIDTVAFAHSSTARRSARRALAEAGGFDAGEPLLLSVAMMRQGDKLASYRLLGTALPRLLADPWRLAVVGDGPARALVETALAPLAGRTLWLGRLAAPALADIYAAADVCVWPAVNEAFGVALIEAQAAGLPVVAGWTPGVAAVVADGETGLLVPAGDTAAFAAAVRRLLGNADIRRRMGEAARQRVADRHSIAGATATLDAALRRLARTGKESRCAGA